MKKKTYGLTVLLLKSDITSAQHAVKEPVSLTSQDITVGATTGTLYFKQNPSHLPPWVKLFQPKVGSTLNKLFNSGTAAVFIIGSGTRLFALTFGYGKSLLLADCYEENFGLRVVLNSVDPDKLRSVDVQSLDAVPLNRRSQASVATALADFGLDIEQDLVYAATGQPKDTAFGKQVTGKDALKISVPLEVDDIPSLLTKLVSQYEADTYKGSFAWVDHLREVRTKSINEKLDFALNSKIQSNEFTKTWLAIPDIIEWSDIAGFKYQKPKQADIRDDIDWESYLAFLGTEIPHTVEVFRKQYVHAISQSSDQAFHSWPVYRCIYCELNLDGADYALSNGKWYRVDTDFLKSLNESLKQIPDSTLSLPEYRGNDEGAYNEGVHHDNPGFFALMDKKMIQHGGGSSKIEFCDLYTTEKHLIHVKRYGGSSVLSHLFAQGTVSARLLLSDPDFRKKVNEKLPASHRLKNVSQKPKAEEFEVVYAIASNSAATAFDLPLFSKINLRNSFNQLQMYGMKASLAVIRVIPSS
ncbi:MAG: TIGR04141 family sporadically distributed protein [Holophaga sp.]|nr:TIGR04141 family sporadically distributed protein [Holophaga sp.]